MEFISQKRNAIDGDSVMKNDVILKKIIIKKDIQQTLDDYTMCYKGFIMKYLSHHQLFGMHLVPSSLHIVLPFSAQ